MAWYYPYKKYEYKLTIDSLDEFYALLNLKFNISDSSGEIIRNSDKPFEFIINNNKFKAIRNVRIKNGKGPTVYGELDLSSFNLKIEIKYSFFEILSVLALGIIFLIFLIIENISILRATFGMILFFSISYILALLYFHFNEERFPMNFEKRFRKYIISKKIIG